MNTLSNSLLNMHYVVGYHLAISPTNYQIDYQKGDSDHTIVMTSHFDTSPKDTCGIPFCCLVPLCRRRKKVVDHLYVDEESSTLRLDSTSAFCGLISCFEAGKVFQVIQDIQPYLILAEPKEILVLSPNQERPSDKDQHRIEEAIEQLDPLLANLFIEYL